MHEFLVSSKRRISSDILSLVSTSTSRSDRSGQAKPPSAMSSDSASTSTDLSPELRVSLHVAHSICAIILLIRTVNLLSCTTQVKPKAVNKVCADICDFTA